MPTVNNFNVLERYVACITQIKIFIEVLIVTNKTECDQNPSQRFLFITNCKGLCRQWSLQNNKRSFGF